MIVAGSFCLNTFIHRGQGGYAWRLMLGVSALRLYAAAMNDHTKLTFIKEDPWRIFRIMAEFVDSFEALSQVGPGVTIFGSARMLPKDPHYQSAVDVANGLAKHNLAIITGGGPGIIEAANKDPALA